MAGPIDLNLPRRPQYLQNQRPQTTPVSRGQAPIENSYEIEMLPPGSPPPYLSHEAYAAGLQQPAPVAKPSEYTTQPPTMPAGIRPPVSQRVPTFAEYKKATSVGGASRCKATREIDKVVREFASNPNVTTHLFALQSAQAQLLPSVKNLRRKQLIGTQLIALITLAAAGVVLAAGVQSHGSSSGSGGSHNNCIFIGGSGSRGGNSGS